MKTRDIVFLRRWGGAERNTAPRGTHDITPRGHPRVRALDETQDRQAGDWPVRRRHFDSAREGDKGAVP
jgi:hypothetical protein